MLRWGRLAFLIFVGLAAVPTVAYAQSSIAGTVRDTSGAVLPGVTVEAASPALIEKVRSAVTDGTGQYRIENLRPGAYTVTFTLPGFATVQREGIQLTGDFVASVNVELRVGTVEETVTVTGAAPVVDVQSTTRQTVLNRELLDALPTTGSQAGYLAGLVTGVVVAAPDVGGINGVGRGGTITVHGVSDVRTTVSGMSMASSNGGGNGGVMNFAAFQEMTVDAGGLGAEQKEGGVRMQFIPRDGGNTVSGSMVIAFANHSMQSDNFTQDLRDRGLGTPNGLDKMWDFNPAVGGPIRRDKLWYHSTFRFTGAKNFVPMFFNKNAGDPTKWTYEPDTSRRAGQSDVWSEMNSRLTWQATAIHKFAVALEYQIEQTRPRALTALTAPESTPPDYSRLAPKRYWQGDWAAPMTNRVLFEGAFLRQDLFASRPATGLNPFLPPGTPLLNSVLEQSTNLRYRASIGGGTNTGVALSRTVFGRVSMSYVTGAHAMKVGVNYGTGSQRSSRISVDSAMDFRFNNGVPNRLTLRATPIQVDTDIDADHGLFAQDKWTIRRLTVNVGLRYDYLHIAYPETHVGPGEFAPNRDVTFPKADGVHWHDMSPRTGLSYDLFGDGKTALKVTLNKYMDYQGASGPFGRESAPSAGIVPSTSRTWTDANGNFVPDCVLLNPAANGECGAMDNTAFGGTRRSLTIDPDLLSGWGNRDTTNWQFSAGGQREILTGVSLDVGYFRSWFDNLTVTDDRSVGPADFDPFSITAPLDPRLPGGGGYVVSGLYDIKPAKFGVPADNLLTVSKRFGKQYRHWNGVDVSVNARPRAGLLLNGGVSTGRATTDNCDVVTKLDNPSPLYCHTQENFLTQVKVYGVYTVPRIDLQVSGSFQNTPGPQITASYVATNAEVQPSLGRPLAGGARNVTVNLIEPGTMYGARLTQVDLRIGKILRVRGVRVTPTLDLYNLLNANTVLSQSNVYGTAWQRPQSVLAARFAKVGLQLNF
jgi:hypothetical protein